MSISLAASTLTSGSFVVMKHSHNIDSQAYWIFGLITLILGAGLNVVALSIGDQTLFSITTSFSIVLNTVFSHLFLKETMSNSGIAGICLIMIGSCLFMMKAKCDNTVYIHQ